MTGIEGEDGPAPVVRRRRSLEERIAEHRLVEQERVRLLRDYAEGCGGSVRRTLSRLSAEIGDKDPVAKSQDMMIRLCTAFDLDLAQARSATQWAELGLGGQVSGEQLEEVVGPRFVVRAGDVVLTSSDVQRQARRQYRIRTLIEDVGTRPLFLRRTFCVWSYEYEDQRLVLRSWDGLPGFGALDIEFRGVQEMKLPPAWTGGELSVTEESEAGSDSGIGGVPGRMFVLSDGKGPRS
ncbi:hypothetical protein [Streptomyces yangpuensis]|uniref:hypothetical protein n=1 Tax=Streptomyces yangpuensis TaxID=1648182 RepID=UPI00371AA333